MKLLTKKQNYEKCSRQEGPHHNGFMPTVISQGMQKHWAALQSAHGWGLTICRLVEGGGCLSPPVASSRQNIPCIRSRELKAAEFSSLAHTCMHYCLKFRKIGIYKTKHKPKPKPFVTKLSPNSTSSRQERQDCSGVICP